MRRSRSKLAMLLAALVLAAVVAVLGSASAWPIYETSRVWLVTGIAAALALGLVWLGLRFRWGALTAVALIAAVVLTVVPVAVPDALRTGPAGLFRGLLDALAAVAVGWKQILTLTLPVGSYQTVLVPLYLLVFVCVAIATALTLRGERTAPWAGLALLPPVIFGAVFGSSTVSESLAFGSLTLPAPRELALWTLAFAGAAVWIAWASGIGRRAALRRGRLADRDGRGAVRRNSLVRGLVGALAVLLAAGAGIAVAPVLDAADRRVPRDRIDPELVVRERVSPLASYRAWKRDDAFEAPLFTVEGETLPWALRLAVLDEYDGVDFTVGDPSDAGRFTRFPSGRDTGEMAEVSVTVEDGYRDIWMPVSTPIGSPPVFGGPRAGDLADSFFVNRTSGAAIAVPTASGLRAGDEYRALMSTEERPSLVAGPVSAGPLIDLAGYPQLERWLQLQDVSPSARGLTTAVERLRARGYLSHSLTDDEGHRQWLDELLFNHAMTFVPSAGGHSAARIGQLFEQLSDQQMAAGDDADEPALVAGIGDDEQFAAASALIARALGYDSRVVVGVRLGGPDGGVPGIPACQEQCEGQHVTAWTEVQGEDGVWVPLDVTPQVEVPPTLIERGEQLPEFATQPEERDATESDPPVGLSEQESGDPDDPTDPGQGILLRVLKIVGLSVAALALLLLPILFLPVAKRIRTRKRRAVRVPEERALSAWSEITDQYADTGASVPARAGRRDVAEQLGIQGGEWLAWMVDHAVYSRESVHEDWADQIWGVVDEDLARRRSSLTRWQRLRAAYSLRSLGLSRLGSVRRGRAGGGGAR